MDNAAEAGQVKQQAGNPDWSGIAQTREFRHLLSAKRRFILPTFTFFAGYYLLFHILIGFTPHLMSAKVWGAATIGYLFALSQFAVGGLLAVLYLRASAKFDSRIAQLLKNLNAAAGGK